jgi:nitrogen fixation protein FixH
MTSTSAAPAAGRPITGRTVLFWLIGFFAVIFAANVAFIYLAVSTFPGLEVASSYKAGQEFEADVEAARAQAERAWKVDGAATLAADGADVEITFADKAGVVLAGLDVKATLAHTVDTAHDRTAVLAETAPGRYVARLPGVTAGQWMLIIEAARRGERQFLSRNTVQLR